MRTEKIQLSSYVSDLIKTSSYLFFISYKGMNVEQFGSLRNQLFSSGSNCHVIKNSLIKLGLNRADIEVPKDEQFKGDTALVFGEGDLGATAKVIKNFGKEIEFVTFKSGVIDGAFISGQMAASIADLPSIEVLRSQLLGVLQAPMVNLAGVLNAKVASIVYVLQSYLNKKEQSS